LNGCQFRVAKYIYTVVDNETTEVCRNKLLFVYTNQPVNSHASHFQRFNAAEKIKIKGTDVSPCVMSAFFIPVPFPGILNAEVGKLQILDLLKTSDVAVILDATTMLDVISYRSVVYI
jgi:hypothetical protein